MAANKFKMQIENPPSSRESELSLFKCKYFPQLLLLDISSKTKLNPY